MSKHANKHQPDNRQPHEIAQAILEHEYYPKHDRTPAKTFADTLPELGEETEVPDGNRWLVILRKIAGQQALTAEEKYTFAENILSDIAAYTSSEQRTRDCMYREANPDMPARTPDEGIHSEIKQMLLRDHFEKIPDDKLDKALKKYQKAQRENQEDAEFFATAVSNLAIIEKEVRALANSMGIIRTEPHRRK